MPTRRTVSLLTITRPERSRGAGQVQSRSRASAGYPRVSNGTPGSRCCPVRSSTYREEPHQCVPNPCRARQAVGVRRSSSRRQRKQLRKLRRPMIPHGKRRPRKRRAYARFGWPRKQPTRRLQVATPRQRRSGDLSHAGAFEDLRPQPRQNPSKAQRDFCPPSRQVCGIIGGAQRAAQGRDQSFRAGQYLQHVRPRPKPGRDLLHAGLLHASRRGRVSLPGS
jgi:hypothetical protein